MRVNYIDIAKGIGILLVVFAHVGNLGYFLGGATMMIQLFHMPLFFLISGMFYKDEKDMADVLTKKSKRLIFPYCFWSLPAFALYLLITPKVTNMDEQIMKFLLGMRDQGYMFTSTLWFLTSLFCCYILCWLIKNKKWIAFPLMLIGVLTDIYNIILPLNMDVSLYVMPFFLVGYILKPKMMNTSFDAKKIRFLVGGVLLSILFAISYLVYMKFYKFPGVDLYGCSFGVYPMNYLSAFSGIFLVMAFSYYISIHRRFFILSKILKFYGKNSIIVLIIHQAFVIHPMNIYIFEGADFFQNGIVRFIITMLFCTLAIIFINKYMWWSIGLKAKVEP